MSWWDAFKIGATFVIWGPFVFLWGPIMDKMKDWYKRRTRWTRRILLPFMWILGKPVEIGKEQMANHGLFKG